MNKIIFVYLFLINLNAHNTERILSMEYNYSDILFKSFLVVISALIGAAITFLLKVDHKKLCSLISLSAGALLGAALFAILPESFESLNFFEVLLSALSGYAVFYLISKYYFHVCPACSASHFDAQTTKRFSEIVLLMITALSFHSIFDGMAIATGSEEHMAFEGSSIFFAILMHKFPEGLALASLMHGANYRKSKIFIYTTLVELTTVLGAAIGLFLHSSGISPVITGIIMAHIAGGFVFLAVHAILGEMIKNHKGLVLSSFAGGMALILLTVYIF